MTIGILTPHLDGDYCVTLMRTMREMLQREYQAKVLLVTAQDLNHYEDRLALDKVNGWLSILSIGSEGFKQALKQRGIPLVGIGFPLEGFPYIMPNNRRAFAEIVQHLVDHGHREIAFVGHTDNPDIADRLQGYKEALIRNGIAYNPDIVFLTRDTLQAGGRLAGQAFMELKHKPSATAAATDMNAIGFMEVLQEHGCRIPEDVAVTGFDNLEFSRWCRPQLSTIDVYLEDIGAQAVRALHDQIRNPADRESGPRYAAHRIILRGSCGCPESEDPAAEGSDVSEHRRYIKLYQDISVTVFRVMTSYKEIGRKLVTSTVDHLNFLNMLFANYHFPSSLGLDATGDGQLSITYLDNQNNPVNDARTIRQEQFPTSDFLAQQTEDQVTAVIPMRLGHQFFGALAAHCSIRDQFVWKKMDMLHHACDMFMSSLERERLHLEIKGQEERYRELAETLEIVSRTTNDGILVWQHTGRMYHFNQQLVQLLDLPRSSLQGGLERLRARVHPEDQPKLMAYLGMNPERETRRSFQLEIRLRHTQGHYLWAFTAGECLYDGQAGGPYKVIASLKDITERKEAEEKINFMAYHDMLTGLPNRTKFFESLSANLKLASSSGRKSAVLILDMDRFKLINDTFGHPVGDKLLKYTADRLLRCIPAGAVAARLGGDEFAVLIPEVADKERAMDAVHAIHQQFETPFREERIELYAKVSIGLSVYPSDGQTQEELLRVADERMYRAKYEGRSRI